MLFKRLSKLQITKDFLGMSFIGIFSRFLSAFALIILIRYISIEDFGKFSILKTTLNHSVVFLLLVSDRHSKILFRLEKKVQISLSNISRFPSPKIILFNCYHINNRNHFFIKDFFSFIR